MSTGMDPSRHISQEGAERLKKFQVPKPLLEYFFFHFKLWLCDVTLSP